MKIKELKIDDQIVYKGSPNLIIVEGDILTVTEVQQAIIKAETLSGQHYTLNQTGLDKFEPHEH